MSERTDRKSLKITVTILPLMTTLIDASKIIISNPQIFLYIYTFTALPISILLISLCITSHPLKSHINHLQSITLFYATRSEGRHVWKESRAAAISLLHTKLFFSIPTFVLSLVALIAAVDSTVLAYQNKRPNLQTALKAIREIWKRPFVTSLCVYAVMLSCAAIIRICLAMVDSPAPNVLIAAAGVAIEVYLIAVTSLGLVISIMEDHFGFDAIRVGLRIMEGKRRDGWILSGLFVSTTGGIGVLLNSQDLIGHSSWKMASTVPMGLGGKTALVCLFGLVILWSYVVTAVFYCECRKKHAIVKGEIGLVDGEMI